MPRLGIYLEKKGQDTITVGLIFCYHQEKYRDTFVFPLDSFSIPSPSYPEDDKQLA